MPEFCHLQDARLAVSHNNLTYTHVRDGELVTCRDLCQQPRQSKIVVETFGPVRADGWGVAVFEVVGGRS